MHPRPEKKIVDAFVEFREPKMAWSIIGQAKYSFTDVVASRDHQSVSNKPQSFLKGEVENTVGCWE
jgi:hypothetical protein